jgi:hypothetical protein
MESNSLIRITPDSTTNSERSFETSKIRFDTIEYRGEEVVFLSSVDGVDCWARWRGKLYNLGLNNIHYKEDMCRVVDRELDLITDFRNCPDFAGAKLEYFHNGDFRDIRLCYKGRILKVFLVAGPVNETWLISESEKILRSSGLLTET